MDLEATDAKLEHQSQELVWQQATQPPLDDDDTHMGAPSMLCFTHVAYNMVSATCHLEDIFDTPDPKNNEQLHEARRLFRVSLSNRLRVRPHSATPHPLDCPS